MHMLLFVRVYLHPRLYLYVRAHSPANADRRERESRKRLHGRPKMASRGTPKLPQRGAANNEYFAAPNDIPSYTLARLPMVPRRPEHGSKVSHHV